MHVSRQIQSQLFVNQGDMPEILYDEDLSVTLPYVVAPVAPSQCQPASASASSARELPWECRTAR